MMENRKQDLKANIRLRKDNMRKRMLLIFTMLLGMTSPIYGAEYYVAYQTGSDSNSGTKLMPRKTIPAYLSPGDIVYLKRGEIYDANYTFNSSGTDKVHGTNATISADGLTLTASGANFMSDGVNNDDKIYINGEGLFGISSVDSETKITLRKATRHKSLSNIAYCIGKWIILTIDEAWGTGSAVVDGQFRLSNESYIRIDGVLDKGIEIINSTDWGIYVNSGSSTSYGLIFQNLYIHDNKVSIPVGGIYFRFVEYALVQNCKMIDLGLAGSAQNGSDGFETLTHAYYITVDNSWIQRVGDDGIQFSPCEDCYVQFTHIEKVGWVGSVASGNVHPDGLATNKESGQMHITFRYNTIKDCRNATDLEHAWFEWYYNIIYNTGESPENHGIRLKLNASGKFYNNIIAWQNYAVYCYDDMGTNSEFINNIFYENATYSSHPEVRYSAAQNSKAKHNIYVRKNYDSQNNIISWGSPSYTLSGFQALVVGPDNDNGTGSKACTPSNCDWVWGDPYLFVSENRSLPDFRPYATNSPQVNNGISLQLEFDTNGNPIPYGLPPTIGAYQFSSDLIAPQPPNNLRILTVSH